MGSGLVTVVLKKPSHSSRPYSPAEREGVRRPGMCAADTRG